VGGLRIARIGRIGPTDRDGAWRKAATVYNKMGRRGRGGSFACLRLSPLFRDAHDDKTVYDAGAKSHPDASVFEINLEIDHECAQTHLYAL
jgi:hypothetical protein